MEKNARTTKFLAIMGAVLVLFPVAAAIFFSAARLTRGGPFMIDYLLPGELFFIILLGGALLLWASIRAKKVLKPVLWTFGLAIILLLAAIGLATATGLASGTTPSGGWESITTTGLMIGSDLAVIALGIAGIKLISAIK